MKRRTGIWKRAAILGIAAILMTGCGSNKSEVMMEYAETEMAESAAYDAGSSDYLSDDIYAEEAVEEEGTSTQKTTVEENAAESDRKLIRNVNMEVETETFDELLDTVEARTKNLGGYIENSYTYNGSSYYGRTDRTASMNIRIPAEKLDEFLSAVSDVSNVISRNESVTDITLQYVDMESHKKALQAEESRLLELMEQAESIEDIITLESRLSEVRYQIESMESQLRTYDNKVSYSTVYLDINEVTKLTPVKEQSVGEKIATGFMESLYGVGNGLLNFAIGLIIRLPYLVVWAVVIIAVVMIVKGIRRKKKMKKMSADMTVQKQVNAENMQENAVYGVGTGADGEQDGSRK